MKTILLFPIFGLLLAAQTTGTASRTNSNTYQAGKIQTFLGVVDSGGATRTVPCRRGTGAPTGQAGTQGDCYYDNTATAGSNLWWATTGGTPATWTLQAGAGGGGTVNSVSAGTGAVITGTGADPIVGVDTAVLPLLGAANQWSGLNNQVQQIATKAIAYTTTNADSGILCDTSTAAGVLTMTLPASPTTGLIQRFVNNSANLCTIAGNGKNIDGSASYTGLAASGDAVMIQYNGTQWLKFVKPSTGGAGAPVGIDQTILQEFDEFFPTAGVVTCTGAVGKLGWTFAAVSSGGCGILGTSSGFPGVEQLVSNAVVNGGGALHLGGASFAFPISSNLATTTNLEYRFSFITDPYFGTQTIWRVGLTDGSGQLPTNGIWVRYANSAACTNVYTDTTFIGETRSAGTSSTVNTTVSAAVATTYNIKIFSTTAGTWQFAVSTSGGAYSTPVTLATNVPTVVLSPVFQLFGCDGTNHTFYIDRFDIRQTGLVR